MKKVTLFLFVFIMFLTAQENLLTKRSLWTAQVDEYGSSLDTSGGLFQNGVLKIKFVMAGMKKEEEWPYVELIALQKGLAGVKAIEVVYRCAQPVDVKLSQPDFSWEGDESYAHYQCTLPGTNGKWVTTTLLIAQFKQPTWAPESAKKVALKLSTINGIYFTPVLDQDLGGSSLLELKSVRLIK